MWPFGRTHFYDHLATHRFLELRVQPLWLNCSSVNASVCPLHTFGERSGPLFALYFSTLLVTARGRVRMRVGRPTGRPIDGRMDGRKSFGDGKNEEEEEEEEEREALSATRPPDRT